MLFALHWRTKVKNTLGALLKNGPALAPLALVRAFESRGIAPMLIWKELLRTKATPKEGQ